MSQAAIVNWVALFHWLFCITTGFHKINRTIQTVNRVYENSRKIRPFTLVSHRRDKQEEKKLNVHLNIIYCQTFRICPVITSLFNRMVRQLIVHDKQLRFCISMCQNLWNQKIGHRIVQT